MNEWGTLLTQGQAIRGYLDPATTSYIIQAVAGVVIACGVAVGIFWKKVRLFFRNIKMKLLEKKLSKQAEKRDQTPQD